MITITIYGIMWIMSFGLVIVSLILYVEHIKTDESFLGNFGLPICLALHVLLFEFIIKKEFIGKENGFEDLAYGLIFFYFALSWSISFGWYKKDPPS